MKLLISSDGETVAMKTVDLMKHPEAVDNVRKEICTHRMLVHPNVIKFLGQRKENFIQYIFLEYASGGELFDRIGMFLVIKTKFRDIALAIAIIV